MRAIAPGPPARWTSENTWGFGKVFHGSSLALLNFLPSIATPLSLLCIPTMPLKGGFA